MYRRQKNGGPVEVRRVPQSDRTAGYLSPDPRFIGSWVVLAGDVCWSGSTAKAVYDQAKLEGIDVPFVVYVSPHRDSPLQAGGSIDYARVRSAVSLRFSPSAISFRGVLASRGVCRRRELSIRVRRLPFRRFGSRNRSDPAIRDRPAFLRSIGTGGELPGTSRLVGRVRLGLTHYEQSRYLEPFDR